MTISDYHRARAAFVWAELQGFCQERGWPASLTVNENPAEFGRVVVEVHKDGSLLSFYGDLAANAVRSLAQHLQSDGFECREHPFGTDSELGPLIVALSRACDRAEHGWATVRAIRAELPSSQAGYLELLVRAGEHRLATKSQSRLNPMWRPVWP